jgi:hypothetical protein
MTSLLLLLMTSLLLLLLAASRRQVSDGRPSLVSDQRFTMNALRAKREKNQNGKWCLLSGSGTAFRLLGLFFHYFQGTAVDRTCDFIQGYFSGLLAVPDLL